MSKIDRIKELVNLCNKYRNAYYNKQPLVPDDVYDKYFDELAKLENETKCYYANSPTQSVGYEVANLLPKVKHNIPLLSLAKTKLVEDVVKFIGNKDVLFMIKCDGLTTKLKYKSYDGVTAELVEASTRGNGEKGTLITANAKTFNIPIKINYGKDLTIVGESVILKKDFEEINAKLPEEDKYSNSRNLASGSLSLLDSKECAKRHIHFMAFDVIEGMDNINSLYDRFEKIKNLGFEPVYHIKTGNTDLEDTTNIIKMIHDYAEEQGIPCDGTVIRFDDYSYGLSLGRTNHHYNYGLAKKEEDDLAETIFRGIEWNTSRNGIVVPTGLFDPVNILDSQVSRATLHNLDYIDNLKLKYGDKICISKRNMVIPAIEVNLDYDSKNYTLPIIDTCPSCGEKLIIKNTGNTRVLFCSNEKCPARILSKFTHFASKNCMDIKNLSESTLNFLINKKWLSCYKDLYNLKSYQNEWEKCEGFGKTSVQKILNSIEESRNTELKKFISALGIEGIGVSASKTVSAAFEGDFERFIKAFDNNYNWEELEDFGTITALNLINFVNSNKDKIIELAKEFNFKKTEKVEIEDNPLKGIKFCITGSFSQSRDELKKSLEAKGAKFVSGVSKNIDVLYCGEKAGSKLTKAQNLGIKIVNEEELLKLLEVK